MIEKTMVVGSFQCNCRLFACPRTGEALLVDPGDEPELILEGLKNIRTESGLPIQIKYLMHTHGHLDHIGATRTVREALSQTYKKTDDRKIDNRSNTGLVPQIALHRGDEPLYLNLKMQGNLFGMTYPDPLPIDHFLEDGEDLRVGDLKLSILHTPGHSPGSVCIRLHEDSTLQVKETLLTGDTLFFRSVGRTDLWGGDQNLMFKNIKNRILTLDGDTRVCPGHGPDSRVGSEKRENPFLR